MDEKPTDAEVLKELATTCERCQKRPGEDDGWGQVLCRDCQDELAEQAWERYVGDGETYRGKEAEAALAEEQDRIRRTLK
jgi:hypothetical protein